MDCRSDDVLNVIESRTKGAKEISIMMFALLYSRRCTALQPSVTETVVGSDTTVSVEYR